MIQINKPFRTYGWTAFLFSVLLIAHIILSNALQDAGSFASSYSVVLIVTWLGIGLLLFLVIKQSRKLVQQRKEKKPGARITSRLTLVATVLMAIPAITIYLFSINFIQQGVNQWFDVKTETALENAAQLSRLSLDNQTRQTLKLTQTLSRELQEEISLIPIDSVSKIRKIMDAQEVALFQTLNKQLIAFSSQDNLAILPSSPADNLFQQVRQKKTYASIETDTSTNTEKQFIRIFVPLDSNFSKAPVAMQVIVPLSDNIRTLSNSVAIAADQYKQLSYLRKPLTDSLVLLLSTLVLLSIASTILFSVNAITQFARPIRRLARGTQQVSEGDYSVKIKVDNDDEFGDLAKSFNDMTSKISNARNEIKRGEQRSTIQRLYFESILQNLKSGVITLDTQTRLRTVNIATEEILDCSSLGLEGKEVSEIIEHARSSQKILANVFQEIQPFLKQTSHQYQIGWAKQVEISSKSGQKILLLSGSTLTDNEKKVVGYVVVIDDITQVAQAQLNAAWSDVARRLAHEIKNPLTPIQLSAERLQYKLDSKLDSESQAFLNRMTTTIIDQVTSMKSLVQAFSDYANTPEVTLQPYNLNHLIRSVVEMYPSEQNKWELETSLFDIEAQVMLDKGRMRQLLHNLIKNAVEAIEEQENGRIYIQTVLIDHSFQLSICDNGPGIPDKDQNWIFEPYATDKPKGTGLGLAIVRKVVDEHHGNIRMETSPEGGCCFIITLPIVY